MLYLFKGLIVPKLKNGDFSTLGLISQLSGILKFMANYTLSTYYYFIISLKIFPPLPPKKSNFNDLSLASIGLEKNIIDKQALHVSI